MSHEPIKPCPFCGHVGLDFTEGSTFRWIVASCGGCGATTGETRIQTLGEGTRDEWMAEARQDAISAWNRRTIPPAPAVAAEPTDSDLLEWLLKQDLCITERVSPSQKNTDYWMSGMPRDRLVKLRAQSIDRRTWLAANPSR